ncbi:MAG: hypothetical protein QOD32_497 [Pyrinomonadaceae bacterium]|jgi:HEAT repeat protein|nr:hypothetical protein [Pyrinomonadaceae bacterium]
MKKQTQKRSASDVPSIPDFESKPDQYNEPDVPRKEDQMPDGGFKRAQGTSRAELRLRVEELLARREAPPTEAWLELGDGAREILTQLLGDVSITKREAMKQRTIATLGQLRIVRAVPQLGELLLRSSEDTVTRAYAASALGRIGDELAIPFLGQAVALKDEMVRRQVTLALGRTRHPRAVPHLLKLLDDSSEHISSAAATELRSYEQELGIKLGVKLKTPKASKKQTPRAPAAD